MKGCTVRETRNQRIQLSLFSAEEGKEAQVRFCDNRYCTLMPSVLQRGGGVGREGERERERKRESELGDSQYICYCGQSTLVSVHLLL